MGVWLVRLVVRSPLACRGLFPYVLGPDAHLVFGLDTCNFCYYYYYYYALENHQVEMTRARAAVPKAGQSKLLFLPASCEPN
jgi:hypothetical protein